MGRWYLFPTPILAPNTAPPLPNYTHHDCCIDLAASNDFPARWIHARRVQDARFYGQVMGTQASQKKKYCSGLVPVRTLSPALSTVTLKMCSADFHQQQHTPSKRCGDYYKKQQNRPSSSIVLCKEVESWTHTVQKLACWLRESTAMQTVQCDGDRRAHLPQDRRGLLPLFLCNPTKQCFTEITTAKTSSKI